MDKIRLRLPRTALAFLLTGLAIAVPCAAWFVTGRSEIGRSARLEAQALHQKAQAHADQLATRLAKRLEHLRKVEERRPFYHYQNLYHDPKGAAEGASVSISPLAHGPPNPWIVAHFQIDDKGLLRLPTVNDQFPELGLPADSSQCALLTGLEEVALLCSDAFGEPDGHSCNQQLDPMLLEVPGDADRPDGDTHHEFLAPNAWWQHQQANVLYADLKNHRKTVMPQQSSGRVRRGQIRIDVGRFIWHTLPVGETPSLVALRDIQTPSGPWVQGFVVDRNSVEQTLLGTPYPASFVPSIDAAEHRPSWVMAPVDGTPWAVVLDLTSEVERIGLTGSEQRDRFFRMFILGSLAAGLTGLLVVGLVYQAERLAEQRSRFAANAAHELRTPLAGLRLYGEMLAEGLGDPSHARLYAQRVASEAERLGRVVTNVLGFTRLERHILNVQPELGDLSAAVEEAVQRHRPAFEEAGVEFEARLEEALPLVRFDRDAVAQILQNLLDNAEKYTREVEDRRIIVQLEQRGEKIDLTVSDNGKGVRRQVQKRLFRPFARGGDRDAPEGLGLGLVLVKALVKAQGGTISYRDAPAGGAMFIISLPCPVS